MRYLDPDQLKNRHGELARAHGAISGFVRSGKAIALLERYLPNRETRILDCGCANGAFLRTLAEHGYRQTHGVDLDTYLDPGTPRVEFKTADVCFEALPWPDGFFDAVVSWETLEHLENPHFLVRQVHRVLKPGGLFFISMPNPFHILSRLLFLKRGDLYHYLKTDNHITFFTPSVFRKTFGERFETVETGFHRPQFKYRALARLPLLGRLLPENQWFSRYVYYVLKQRAPSTTA